MTIAEAPSSASFDGEIAISLRRAVLPKEVAVLVGGCHEDRRRLALTFGVHVARLGLPVLVAAPGTTLTSLPADLVTAGWTRREDWLGSGGCSEDAAVRVDDQIHLLGNPRQSLSTLWRFAAEKARCRSEPLFGLVIIDRFDAYESFEDDLMRLRQTASVLGAPVFVVPYKTSRARALVGASDVVVVLEEAPCDARVGQRPAVWVGFAPRGGERTVLVPLHEPLVPPLSMPLIVSSLKRLGGILDPTDRRIQRDDDGAVLGWRVFTVSTSPGERAQLRSPFQQTSWSSAVQTARCTGQTHVAPDPDCACGIYAVSVLEGALSQVNSGRGEDVVALVRGWGRVAIHEEGWRAEHVAPVVVFGTMSEDVKADLAYRYECEVVSSGRRRRWCISDASFESKQSSSTTVSSALWRRRRHLPPMSRR